MSKLEIPYTELDLRIGLIEFFGIGENEERDKSNEEILKKVTDILSTDKKMEALASGKKADMNKYIAEDNGISVIDLINSPNYEILVSEFHASVIKAFVSSCVEGGMTHKSAWALIAIGLGLID